MLKTLHQSDSRQATWLELFFDLVFVAVIGVVTHDLAHTHDGHLGTDQLLRFPLVFIPVWWIWTTHTLYANRFDNNDRAHRLFALVIMALLVLLSTQSKESHGETFVMFTLLYSVIRVLLAVLYFRVHSKVGGEVTFAKELGKAILLGALISSSAVIFDGLTKFLIFYCGIAVDIAMHFRSGRAARQMPVDRKHLVERIGLLSIIILGESIISMVGSLSQIPTWDTFSIMAAVTGFVMTWAIWWIYFDSFETLEQAKRIKDGNVLLFTHLFLCMGLIILANLIGHSIKRDLDQATFQILAIAGMCSFYFGKQVIYYTCFPPFRKMILINTGVCLGITVMSTLLPRIEYSLIGITAGMLFYVYSTFKWLLPNNVEAFTVTHNQ